MLASEVCGVKCPFRNHFQEDVTENTASENAQMPGVCFKLGFEVWFWLHKSNFTVHFLDNVCLTEMSGLKITMKSCSFCFLELHSAEQQER